MKDFSEQDPLDDVVGRLSQYSEQPDDAVWDHIYSSLHSHRRLRWLPWIDSATGLIMAMTFSFLIGMYLGVDREDSPVHVTHADRSQSDPLPYVSESETRELITAAPENGPANSHSVDTERRFAAATEGKFQIRGEDLSHLVDIDKGEGLSSTRGPSTLDIFENPTNDSIAVNRVERKDVLAKEINAIEYPKEKNVRMGRWSFYGQITPMVSFQKISPLTNDGVVMKELLDRSLLSSERLAYSIEGGIQGWLTHRMQYYAGISFYK